jgi:hypothetical protein
VLSNCIGKARHQSSGALAGYEGFPTSLSSRDSDGAALRPAVGEQRMTSPGFPFQKKLCSLEVDGRIMVGFNLSFDRNGVLPE